MLLNVTFTDPTTNTDSTPITAGEITGYNFGIRPESGTAGNYPVIVPVPGATSTSAQIETSKLTPPLAPGKYFAAMQTVGPVDSTWTNEVGFTVPLPQPNPPSNFSIA